MGLLLALAALAGCREEVADPLLQTPLAEWRRLQLPSQLLKPGQGGTLRLPQTTAISCIPPSAANAFASCDFFLYEADGRLVPAEANAAEPSPGRPVLRVSMVLEPEAYAAQRRMTRADPARWPATPAPLPQPPVRQALEGVKEGRPFALGCWARPPHEALGDYACRLAIGQAGPAATLVEFAAEAPPGDGMAPADRARLRHIFALVTAVEASFRDEGDP
ncbi:hypothetical protein [Roseomonas sp. 18066]|uniref:hypothetical protein n=1 Tax=Roseomonas sp. 18066 TaxID=2681412 RepID=UPI001359C7F5|nr:hypothetical protein [Roseomonas sp. 18066]